MKLKNFIVSSFVLLLLGLFGSTRYVKMFSIGLDTVTLSIPKGGI